MKRKLSRGKITPVGEEHPFYVNDKVIFLKRITIKQGERYKVIGEGFGQCVEHCFHEGLLHSKNFLKRVKYFAVISDIADITKEASNKVNCGRFVTARFYEDAIVL